MKTKLTIFILMMLLVMTAALALSVSAVAQQGHTIYVPLVQRDSCSACAPRPTPTPRMWHIWEEQE